MQQLLPYLQKGALLDLGNKLSFINSLHTNAHKTLLGDYEKFLYNNGFMPYLFPKSFYDANQYPYADKDESTRIIEISDYFSLYCTLDEEEKSLRANYMLLKDHPSAEHTRGKLLDGLEFLMSDKDLSSFLVKF